MNEIVIPTTIESMLESLATYKRTQRVKITFECGDNCYHTAMGYIRRNHPSARWQGYLICHNTRSLGGDWITPSRIVKIEQSAWPHFILWEK